MLDSPPDGGIPSVRGVGTAEAPEGLVKIVHQPNRHGGRLVYYQGEASAAYWDALWEQKLEPAAYQRSLKGHLAHQLRRSFGRWVAPPARVLEAGCGLGHFTVALHARGYRAEGVDWAEQTVARLRELFPQIPFFRGDVRHLTDIADESYDAVYSPGVCEHFAEGPEQIIAETHRILRTGGYAVVSTPCFNGLRRLAHRLGAYRGSPSGEFYQYAFSSAEMRAVLEASGFEVVQEMHSGSLKTVTDLVPPLERLMHPRLAPLVAVIFDRMPVTRRWGHSCIWVARKESLETSSRR